MAGDKNWDLPLGLGAPRSDGQTFAAFGATRIDHGATAPGFHSNQKSMGACATNFGRLVCAFHLEILGKH